MEQIFKFHSSHDVGASDGGDEIMARWLQSAGLQHLAAPLSAAALDYRLLPSLLMQDYARFGVQSAEDKQKLLRLIQANISGGDSVSEPSTPPARSRSASRIGMDVFLSPELRGDFNSGILDLHSIDDTEFFPEIAIPEPFQSSSSLVPVIKKGLESDVPSTSIKGRMQVLSGISPLRFVSNEREKTGNNGGLARIRVVVRKRPLNKKELQRKEEDIVTIGGIESSLTVHEPKVKVDLTAYVERHEFVFDAVLDQQVSNDEVYRSTVEPIVPTIFNRTKATCFAYGQTGSGKTYTMQPLPLRASEDIMVIMQQPSYRKQSLQLWLSFFEIYGGKLYDLLNERRKLCMREDGRQQVCIVGLKEFRVSDVELVKEYIDKGNLSRSTGCTGANEESSRSHAILQLVVKKAQEGKEVNRVVGKLSFIDLAGSERGADTTDNDRQTRMEGAEINKSLLALKECIRALDNEQGHIPFRGSKLTEVLRDSFVGDSRTVMISCVSPNAGSCEHTLNTLRYADRVKGLSKNNNSKRDYPTSSTLTTSLTRESNSSPPPQVAAQVSDFGQDSKLTESCRRLPLDPGRYLQQGDRDLSNHSLEYSHSSRELGKVNTAKNERDRQGYTDPSETCVHDLCGPDPQEAERNQGGLSARRKIATEEKFHRSTSRDDLSKPDGTPRLQVEYSRDEVARPDGNLRRNRDEVPKPDGNSIRYLEHSRDEISERNGNLRRQSEYKRDDLSRPDVYLRRQFESNRDDVSKSDGSARRLFEYNRDELFKPDGKSRLPVNNNRDETLKTDGTLRRQMDQASIILSHTRIVPEFNPQPFNREGHINAILEEEEEVISAHRKEVEDTMEIVREEMKLLADVDQPGSRIDRYVTQLNHVLSRKTAGIVNLQARLARFQRHLKEQEILSRTGGLQQM